MLRNFPFDGDFPIIQQFGDSPLSFRCAICEEVNLRGHHGLDFGLPHGEPVLAVSSGEVAATANDARGFGRYVLLAHHWGQSFYAHLSRVEVNVGQEIDAGQQIGRSGESGLCLEPHLHFGLRVNPYSLGDRWCGYTDPLPYLHRIAFGRGPLIGPHVIASVPAHLHVLNRWQPRLITVLDPNPDEIRLLRRACPDAVIVGRIYTHDAELPDRIRQGPHAAARWAHAQTAPYLSPDIDYYQVANEIMQDAGGLPLLMEFELARMKLAEEHGYACALFGLAVGNPDLPRGDRMARWRLLYPALTRAEARGHIVAIHQYGMPDLWGPHGMLDWYIYRLEHQVLRRLPFKHLQFAVTETGIDGLIAGDVPSGWQNFMGAREYIRQLQVSGRYTERYSGQMLGASTFTLGHFPPWSSYEIQGEVARSLADTSDRGTWADVQTRVDGIDPHDFEPILEPGVEALPDRSLITSLYSEQDSQLSRRLDSRFDRYHMQIVSICDRPDKPCKPTRLPHPGGADTVGLSQSIPAGLGVQDDLVYVVKDVFMTANGSWEQEGRPSDVPYWARKDYLVPEFAEAGADRHLFGAVLDLDGRLLRDVSVTYWPDGLHRLGDPTYEGYVTILANRRSGWTNIFLSGGSSFDPDRGDSGPWCWMPSIGPAEVICGGGLPLNHHVSTFVVWQAMRRTDWEKSGLSGVNNLPYPGIAHPIRRRTNFCATYFGLSIQPLTRSPDAPADAPIYVVRDLFAVLAEPNEAIPGAGAYPEWASEEYELPPLQNDAADNSAKIYAAVATTSGEFIPAVDINFVRGDFDALRGEDDSVDASRIVRRTSGATGWAQMPMNESDAYSPARGMTGPWCWAPSGAAEAVCGAGMPDGKHVALFAVWQSLENIS